MATNLEGKLWVHSSCRTGERWVPPGYFCPRRVIWLALTPTNQITGLVKTLIYSMRFLRFGLLGALELLRPLLYDAIIKITGILKKINYKCVERLRKYFEKGVFGIIHVFLGKYSSCLDTFWTHLALALLYMCVCVYIYIYIYIYIPF